MTPERAAGGPLAVFVPPIAGDDAGRPLRCRAAVASTPVAGLERARDGAVILDQAAAWTEIRISGRADSSASPDADTALAGSDQEA